MVLKILQNLTISTNYVDIVWACPTHNFEQYVNLLNGEWTDEWSPFNRQDWSPIQAETSALIFAIFLLELTWFKSGGRGVIRESIKRQKNCSKYIMCIIRWFLTRHCHNNAHSARQYEQGVNRPISISIACKTVRKETTWGRIMLQEQSLLICLLYQNLGYEWWLQDLWCFCDG